MAEASFLKTFMATNVGTKMNLLTLGQVLNIGCSD